MATRLLKRFRIKSALIESPFCKVNLLKSVSATVRTSRSLSLLRITINLNTCFIVGNEDDILFAELYIGCRISINQKVVNVDCFEGHPVADQFYIAERSVLVRSAGEVKGIKSRSRRGEGIGTGSIDLPDYIDFDRTDGTETYFRPGIWKFTGHTAVDGH